MQITEAATVQRIRELNDQTRKTFTGARFMLSSGVAALEPDTQAKVLSAFRNFSEFSGDNDPHGEHDMVFFDVDGQRYWGKVDYYDVDMRYLSDDPANVHITRRVWTIGTPSEY